MDVYSYFSVIDTLIFDIDGVWTNGDLLVCENGDLLRVMNSKDGYAGYRAMTAGYKIVVITGGISKGVSDRLEKLGVTEIHTGIKNKLELFQKLVAEGRINPETSLFMGDDVPDKEVMESVHLACCPKDAVPEVKQISQYISPFKGGKGCVRDVIEKMMRVQDKW